MNSLAFPRGRCSPSPLTRPSTSRSSSVPSSRTIKIRPSSRSVARCNLRDAKNLSPSRTVAMAAAAAAPASSEKEVLPPSLTSSSEPPPLFDGTTRLYVAYHCPYAQRAWIARNYKGLQDKIKIVPSLEHNNQVKGESLDLVKYIDTNFEGPALLPDDSEKQQFAEELLAYTDAFNKASYSSIVAKGDVSDEAVAALDKIEAALSKFNDGPFFLGQFSLVDIAYVPFIERFQIFFSGIKNYDITKGLPNLQKFIEEVNKIHAYTETKQDPRLPEDVTKDEPTTTCDGDRELVQKYAICNVHNHLDLHLSNHLDLANGLQEKIKLVPMDTNDRPAWYKEVYPKNTLPSLEHNNKIIGESLDLIKYIDINFAGPRLTPDVDIAYAPFIDGFQTLFAGIKNYDITEGRANIQIFIKELNKIDAYMHTKQDPSEVIALTKKKLGGRIHRWGLSLSSISAEPPALHAEQQPHGFGREAAYCISADQPGRKEGANKDNISRSMGD
uniref:GST N-terminal domain-containing protein n=1 Tax=Oryza rufipogon TaxID=4529 RepID=A0A0E0NTG9_ORYRU